MAFLPFIGPAIDLINGILGRVLPVKMDEADRAKLQQELTLELMKADWSAVTAQLAINAKEAEHKSIFVAGWRPFIGWICGSALGYHMVLQPFLAFLILACGWQLPPLPTLDTGSLMAITTGLLGLGAYRTYEKKLGVQGAH